MCAARPAARRSPASSLATSPGAELVPRSSERFQRAVFTEVNRTRWRARL